MRAAVLPASPITQGTLLRLLLRQGLDAREALTVLEGFTTHERHVFWPDDPASDAGALWGVLGHRQVTDGYLAGLARSRGERLATFDRGLAVSHAEFVELLPT